MFDLLDGLAMLAGLASTAYGAWIAAQGVFLDEPRADSLSGTNWDSNPHLKAMLLEQSAKAKRGLIWIAVGTVIQMIATAMPMASKLLS